ncbi:MAG TPA: glutathione S-transferase C-terminal domain-containing protein [Polyangiaceae bacterium]|nr:glutathione S-transferase C-terminal domain-containing protein [Polyangiaceae bacterium]
MRQKVRPVLAVLDRALEGKSYLVGNTFTLADMVYMPDLGWLHAAGEGAERGRATQGLMPRRLAHLMHTFRLACVGLSVSALLREKRGAR